MLVHIKLLIHENNSFNTLWGPLKWLVKIHVMVRETEKISKGKRSRKSVYEKNSPFYYHFFIPILLYVVPSVIPNTVISMIDVFFKMKWRRQRNFANTRKYSKAATFQMRFFDPSWFERGYSLFFFSICKIWLLQRDFEIEWKLINIPSLVDGV